MIPALHPRLETIRPRLIAGGVVAAVLAVVLGWRQPSAIVPAYQLAVFVCLAPAVGSLFFALVHRCTGGHWGETLAPFLAAGSRLAPWIWLGVAPLLFFQHHATASWPHYDSEPMLALRTALYAVILFALTLPVGRRPAAFAFWLGPVGLIVLLFTFHLLADDWLAALEPGWDSTAFPLVWMLGQSVSGLGCAVLAVVLLGLNPSATGRGSRPVGLDWGNLLLTALLLWCYVMFAQFLIIWGGNLPRETSWFEHRLHGAWAAVPWLLLAFHFIVPLFILLSRRFKQSARSLGFVAAILVAAQVLFLTWVIVPAFPANGGVTVLLGVALAGAGAAFFIERYLVFSTRQPNRP